MARAFPQRGAAPQPEETPQAGVETQDLGVETQDLASLRPEAGRRTYVRFDRSQRVEHFILLISFSILGITGLAQKYSQTPLGAGIIGLLGGIVSSRVIHRTAAIVLLAVSIYHVVAALYRVLVLRHSISMLPGKEDFVHLWHDILYYLGQRARRAYYGRYTYAEKVEYLAVVWGTAIMALTGFMMWNPIATAQLLPGEAIPAAKAAHGGEALLAVLSIVLWHFYHVHLRHFNKSMFTGRLTRQEMEHEHPAELAQIEAGQTGKLPPPEVIRRRSRAYFPVAAVLLVGLAYGLFRFVTFEQTAITTLPQREDVAVFVPITPTPTVTPPPPPTLTPLPEGALAPEAGEAASWEGGVRMLLENRCGACHVQGTLGDLSLATYDDALEGGRAGPAIVPGDPPSSGLVRVQQAGGHPGQLSPAELDQVIAWIAAGAPEAGEAAEGEPAAGGAATQEGEAAETATPPGAPTAGGQAGWEGEVQPLVVLRCGACHVQNELGGLSLATLGDALEGGQSGPAVVPGDPEASLLVQVQEAGGHPGQFSPQELALVRGWIEAGAPPVGGAGGRGATAIAPTAAAAPTTQEGEAAGTAAPAAPQPATEEPRPVSWEGEVQPVVEARCAACHVQNELGGLSLATLGDALKGGQNGPAVVPGDPEASLLVQVQEAGGHPGQLSPEELALITGWIEAGAPESPQ